MLRKSARPAAAKTRCKNCDKPYTPAVPWQEFCSATCRKTYWRHGGITQTRMRELFAESTVDHLAEIRTALHDVQAVVATIANMPVLASQLQTRIDARPDLKAAIEAVQTRAAQQQQPRR